MNKRFAPQAKLISGFAILILLGACILCLPGMTPPGHGISFVDALFTATSAVCVTGLVVRDTGRDFTLAGQWVILLLIQLGGLGIMTFSAVVLLMLGKRTSMAQEDLLQDIFVQSPMRRLNQLILYVVGSTLCIEAVGCALYFSAFVADHPPGHALYLSIFHSVSAFCNAGFSPFSDSLVGYRANMVVNLTTIGLIILGGIGFLVLYEVWNRYVLHLYRGQARPKILSLHTRLTLLTTAILIVVGMVFFLAIEWDDSLVRDSLPVKLLVSLFQSVTTRTAGFNTVDMEHLTNPTLFIMIILMFIGASPGSTGGGVKTTTAAVFFSLIRTNLTGGHGVHVFNRTIPAHTMAKAMAVITASVLVVTAGGLTLMITQLGDIAHTESRGLFLEYMFEAVSAFGTVGLSMGATGKMDAVGKVIIIGLMFTGRLGPLTLASALKPRKRAKYSYSQENVMIG
ncbi:MAG: TrkH family potassium uptake protein [Thermodesulfobacteriota bacterium]